MVRKIQGYPLNPKVFNQKTMFMRKISNTVFDIEKIILRNLSETYFNEKYFGLTNVFPIKRVLL